MKVFKVKIFQGLIISLLFIVIMELGLRVADLKFQFLLADAPSWVNFSPSLNYELKPGFRGDIFSTTCVINSLGLRTPEFAWEKGDTFRIVCIGNSCTFGNLLPENETYARKLEKLCRDEFGERVQVINVGIPGYSSYQGLMFLREKILQFQPDLLIASFGFNDRRTVPDSGWIDSAEYFSGSYRSYRIRNILRKSYLYRLIELLFSGGPPSIEGYIVRVDSAKFAQNLEQIAQIAEGNNIPLIFLGIPDNPIILRRYESAKELFEQGSVYTARRLIQSSMKFYSRMERHRFNRWVEDAGIQAEPLAEFPDVMTFFGGLPVYTGEEYNRIIKQTAARLHTYYVELDTIVTEYDYIDFIHFNENGTDKAAQAVFSAIVKGGYID